MEKIHSKLINTQKSYLFLLTSFATLGTDLIMIGFPIYMLQIGKSASNSALFSVLAVFGVIISSLIGTKIISKLQGSKLGILSTLLSILILLVLQSTSSFYNTNFVYAFALILIIINGLELPNTNTSIFRLFGNHENILSKINIFYSVSTEAMSLITPIFIVIILRYSNMQVLIILSVICYMLSIIPWFLFYLNPIEIQNSSSNSSLIYKDIWHNKNLKWFTLTRIGNGFVFSTVAVAVPFTIIWINKHVSTFDITENQAFYKFLTGSMFVVLGLLIAKLTIPLTFMKNLLFLAPCLAAISGLIMFQNPSQMTFILFALSIGTGTFLGRVSSIFIGQNITPKHIMAETILVGDMTTRIGNLLVSLLFIGLANKFTESLPLIFMILLIFGVLINYYSTNKIQITEAK